MGQKHTSRYCKSCNSNTLAVGDTPNHTFHLLLSIFTAGLWLFVWIPKLLWPTSFRCTQCGRSI